MKKQLFFIILILGASLLHAQNKWTKGVVLSMGFSGQQQEATGANLRFQYDESKLMPSLGGGLWVERSLGNHCKLETGLNYGYLQHFNRSIKRNYTILGRINDKFQVDRKYKLHQLYVPLQFRYVFRSKDNKIRPFLMIGSQVSYSLSVTQSDMTIHRGNSGNTTTFKKETYYANRNNDLINHQPISFSFGMGVDFGPFFVELNRTQNALNENEIRETIETPCVGCFTYIHHVKHFIPSIHTILIKLKYRL